MLVKLLLSLVVKRWLSTLRLLILALTVDLEPSVLDVHKKWVDKFEGIALQPADWYNSSEAFSYGSMAGFVTEGLAGMSASFSGFSSVINLMTDSLSDSSGGGGFSGGGSGGGGGSDW